MATKKSELEAIDLSDFDYKNLTGESFKRYVEIVGDRNFRVANEETGKRIPVNGKLKGDEMRHFSLYNVEVIRRTRYEGVQGSPVDFVGVKIKNETPINTTLIPVKTAIELNAQIVNAHAVAGHGRYYLLKK